MSIFATAVVGFIGFGVLLAVIVSLAVPVSERRAHTRGRHSAEFVHGGRR